jgi:hypothetical protein
MDKISYGPINIIQSLKRMRKWTKLKSILLPGMVAHICNPNIWEDHKFEASWAT